MVKIVVSEVTFKTKKDQPCVKIPKKRLNASVERFRQRFGDQPARAIEAVLPGALIKRVLAEEVVAYRERLYPPLTTLGLFIGQAMSPDGACQDAVARHLAERTATALPGCSLSSGPYCKARKRLPLNLITRLAKVVGDTLENACPKEWKWRGRSVKLIDGTTVSMPDTPDNQKVYPQSRAQQEGLGFPQALLVAVISLSTGAVLRWASGPCRGKETGETALLRRLMPELTEGEVVLADRYHCNYFTAALLMERGVDLVTRQHQRRHTDFRRGKRLGKGDQLVDWLRPPRPEWMVPDLYARMPERLAMRQTKVAGRVLVTTLTDARLIPPLELDHLYRRRWQVEVDLRSIKTVMGMDILRAKSAAMIDKEIAVHLLAYNLVCALITRAAAAARVTARRLSFKGALQLLQAFQAQWRFASRASLRTMTAILLGAISRLRLPHRPRRVEPRAIKRRPKNHPLLTLPRQAARDKILLERLCRTP